MPVSLAFPGGETFSLVVTEKSISRSFGTLPNMTVSAESPLIALMEPRATQSDYRYDNAILASAVVEDMLDQMRAMKKLGPLENLVKMLPGGGEMMQGDTLSKGEREMRRMEGIICSMTPRERREPNVLNASRRKRIAAGSGTTVTEVNNLLNRFYQMQQMMKKMGKMQKMMAKMGGGLPGMFGR